MENKKDENMDLIKSHVSPSHYRQGKFEVIDILKDQLSEEEFKGFCKGLAIKYIYRAEHKNGLEDYMKAQVYIGYLIDYLKEKKGL